MVSERLEVRIDPDRKQKLAALAEARSAPLSDVIRELIDRAYDEILAERRRLAVERICQMEIEDVPDPEELSRQLDRTHEIPDLYNDR